MSFAKAGLPKHFFKDGKKGGKGSDQTARSKHSTTGISLKSVGIRPPSKAQHSPRETEGAQQSATKAAHGGSRDSDVVVSREGNSAAAHPEEQRRRISPERNHEHASERSHDCTSEHHTHDQYSTSAARHEGKREVDGRSLASHTSLVGRTLKTRIGGRMVALSYPKDVATSLATATEQELKSLQSTPQQNLVLEYAYGYNGTCRRNLFAVASDTCVYNVACVGVVFNFEYNTQRLFQGHTAEITALSYNSKLDVVATGQKIAHSPGAVPRICIWRVSDCLERLRLIGHENSIDTLVFSTDGLYLFSAGGESPKGAHSEGSAANQSSLHHGTSSAIFLWSLNYDRSDSAPSRVLKHPQAILTSLQRECVTGIVTHPEKNDFIMVYGSNYVGFLNCSWEGLSLESSHVELKRVNFEEKNQKTDYLADYACAGHFCSGVFVSPALWEKLEADLAVVGSENGYLFMFRGHMCIRSLSIMHGASLYYIEPLLNGLVCGDSDGGLNFIGSDLEEVSVLRISLVGPSGTPLHLNECVRCVRETGESVFLVGTLHGEIAIAELIDVETTPRVTILQDTPPDEVFALTVHPHVQSLVAVGCVRGSLRFFDTHDRLMVQMSPYQCKGAVHCLAWGPKGRILAVGLDTGEFELLETLGWEDIPGNHVSVMAEPRQVLVQQAATPYAGRERNTLTDIQFSPEGTLLACGCRDGRVILFNFHLEDPGRQYAGKESTVPLHLYRFRTLTGNASSVITLQFSIDGNYICSNAKDAQVLCWDVHTGHHMSAGDADWFGDGHSYRLTMGWPTVGIWNREDYTDTLDLVAVSDPSAKVLAVGDNNGFVKLHSFPVPMCNAESFDTHCHSSRVTSLAWTAHGRFLTVGASRVDGLLQWYQSDAPNLNVEDQHTQAHRISKKRRTANPGPKSFPESEPASRRLLVQAVAPPMPLTEADEEALIDDVKNAAKVVKAPDSSAVSQCTREAQTDDDLWPSKNSPDNAAFIETQEFGVQVDLAPSFIQSVTESIATGPVRMTTQSSTAGASDGDNVVLRMTTQSSTAGASDPDNVVVRVEDNGIIAVDDGEPSPRTPIFEVPTPTVPIVEMELAMAYSQSHERSQSRERSESILTHMQTPSESETLNAETPRNITKDMNMEKGTVDVVDCQGRFAGQTEYSGIGSSTIMDHAPSEIMPSQSLLVYHDFDDQQRSNSPEVKEILVREVPRDPTPPIPGPANSEITLWNSSNSLTPANAEVIVTSDPSLMKPSSFTETRTKLVQSFGALRREERPPESQSVAEAPWQSFISALEREQSQSQSLSILHNSISVLEREQSQSQSLFSSASATGCSTETQVTQMQGPQPQSYAFPAVPSSKSGAGGRHGAPPPPAGPVGPPRGLLQVPSPALSSRALVQSSVVQSPTFGPRVIQQKPLAQSPGMAFRNALPIAAGGGLNVSHGLKSTTQVLLGKSNTQPILTTSASINRMLSTPQEHISPVVSSRASNTGDATNFLAVPSSTVPTVSAGASRMVSCQSLSSSSLKLVRSSSEGPSVVTALPNARSRSGSPPMISNSSSDFQLGVQVQTLLTSGGPGPCDPRMMRSHSGRSGLTLSPQSYSPLSSRQHGVSPNMEPAVGAVGTMSSQRSGSPMELAVHTACGGGSKTASIRTTSPDVVPALQGGIPLSPWAAPASTGAPTLSVHIHEVLTGAVIGQAALFLYHPPFPLGMAVGYTSGAKAAELFSTPRGWGVLRSSAGLLLWLQLRADHMLQALAAEPSSEEFEGHPKALRFEFMNNERPNSEGVSVPATVTGRPIAFDGLPLGENEGLLRPAQASFQGQHDPVMSVRLSNTFDESVKTWLSLTPLAEFPL